MFKRECVCLYEMRINIRRDPHIHTLPLSFTYLEHPNYNYYELEKLQKRAQNNTK